MKFDLVKHRFVQATLAASLLAAIAVPAVRADVLEQKWQAGQQLAYDLKTDGTMHVTAPEGVPMIAGLPLEFQFKGDGQSSINTVAVDEFDTATVVPRIERLQIKLNETSFGQTGVLGLREGKLSVSVNGQPVMQPMDVSQIINPPYGLRITKQLHVVGLQPLAKEEPARANEPAKDDKKTPFKIPANALLMAQALIAHTLPALLPPREVALGDEWKANVEIPAIPGTPLTQAKQMGTFNLKALAEEEVEGRKTWRISVDGSVKVDEQDSKMVADQMEKSQEGKEGQKSIPGLPFKIDPKMFALFSMTQKVKGSIWFDVAAGQIVKADLRLDATAQTRPNDKVKPSNLFDYGANVKMDLRKVSYENA